MAASRRVSPAERFRAQAAVPAAAITTSPPAIQRGVKCRLSGGLVSGSRWTAAPHGQLLLFGSIDDACLVRGRPTRLLRRVAVGREVA